MSRRPIRTTALALAALVTCAGTAAWSAPARDQVGRPGPGPVLSTHLDYGRYVVSVDPSAIEPQEDEHTGSSRAGVRACPAAGSSGAPVGIRTPNLLIRSQMLYPLSYGRMPRRVEAPTRTGRG